jgi:hypothetical protein
MNFVFVREDQRRKRRGFMQSRLLMTFSAAVMGAAGLTLTFAPEEILSWCGAPTGGFVLLLVQVIGALYFGFAMLNWMVRDNLIGGIYTRPVVVGNLIHFCMVSLVLLRSFLKGAHGSTILVTLGVYVLLAVWFGLVLVRHPSTTAKK